MTYPTTTPDIPAWTAGETLANMAGGRNHGTLHNNIRTEVLAIAAKLGLGFDIPQISTYINSTGGTVSTGHVVVTDESGSNRRLIFPGQNYDPRVIGVVSGGTYGSGANVPVITKGIAVVAASAGNRGQYLYAQGSSGSALVSDVWTPAAFGRILEPVSGGICIAQIDAIPKRALPYVRATGTGTQSIPNGVSTTVLFNTELYDFGAMHSTGSNTDSLIAPVDGMYLVNGQAAFSVNTTGQRLSLLSLNTLGGYIAQNNISGPALTNGILPNLSVVIPASAGGIFKLTVYQDSGAALNIDLGNSWLSAMCVGQYPVS